MMIRKSNERINYDIDHNNVCRWNKIFLFKVYMKEELFNIFVTRVYLTVCFYHVTCTFQSESTLYSCLNFKELFPRNKRGTYLNVCLRNKWLWVGILLQPLGFIFDDIFGPKKNDLFCPVFVFHRGMSIGILKYILYFNNEGLNISWISRYKSILGLKNSFHNTVFYSVSGWT